MESDATQSGGMVNFLAWVEVNKRRLIIGAGVVLAVIFFTVLFVQQQAAKEHRASEALSNVRLPFSAGTPAQAGTADALLKVAQETKGTKAAARALLLSAGIAFSEAKSAGDYAVAQQRFEQVAKDYADSPWIAQANLGIAASLQAQGKATEATAKFEELQRRFGTSAIGDDIRLGLARLYEASKPEDAYKLYDEIGKENPSSVLAMEANLRQDNLVKARPELAKLKEPPPPLTPPASLNPNQQIKITPMTNRVTTNVQAMTNRLGTSQPVEIKLNPSATPTPGAPNTPPPGTKTP
jgi:predicted negative regulator of RcsB-dependent stress response